MADSPTDLLGIGHTPRPFGRRLMHTLYRGNDYVPDWMLTESRPVSPRWPGRSLSGPTTTVEGKERT